MQKLCIIFCSGVTAGLFVVVKHSRLVVVGKKRGVRLRRRVAVGRPSIQSCLTAYSKSRRTRVGERWEHNRCMACTHCVQAHVCVPINRVVDNLNQSTTLYPPRI